MFNQREAEIYLPQVNNYHSNAVKKIELYKQGKTWVFDDEHLNLKAEAFVLGATEAIDLILSMYNINSTRPTMIFGEFLPEFHAKIELIEDLETNGWYSLAGHKLWLCSVLTMFFPHPPKVIYVKFEE